MKKTALLIALMLVCGSLTACGKTSTEENISSNTTVTTTVPVGSIEEVTTETTNTAFDAKAAKEKLKNGETVEIDPFENFNFVEGKDENGILWTLNAGQYFDSEIAMFLDDTIGMSGIQSYVDGKIIDQHVNYPEGTVVTVTIWETSAGDLDDYIAYAKEKGVILTRNSIDVVYHSENDEQPTTEAE